jgi:hypothetical protein
MSDTGASGWGWAGNNYDPNTLYSVRYKYTKPDRWVKLGEPVFKTQKQLLDRAVASDTWDRDTNTPAYGGTPSNVGFAYYGHRDGYNVLYGDWSSRWYGDPQQRLMWWGPLSMGDIERNFAADIVVPQWGGGGNLSWKGAALVWHTLDTANGVDIGVDGN